MLSAVNLNQIIGALQNNALSEALTTFKKKKNHIKPSTK